MISVDAADRETTDAALAHTLQMEEYDQPRPIRRKIMSPRDRRCNKQNLEDEGVTTDSGISDQLDNGSHLSPFSPELDVFEPDDDLNTTEEEELNAPLQDIAHIPHRRWARSSINRTDANDDEDDEDVPSPSYEEQRKLRRVSTGLTFLYAGLLTFLFKAQADRRKLETKHPALVTMWDDLKARPTITPKEIKQPVSITRKLKPFQLEGLNWMMEQEKTPYRGGLLGDEMGMGKTIQAVSLIMSDFPQLNPTLVIVPPVALMQWVSEIKVGTSTPNFPSQISPELSGIHRWQVESTCLSQLRLEGQEAY